MKPKDLSLAQISVLPKTHEEEIPESYLDSMGHMNVMWYTHLFSQAMGGLFRSIGLTPEYMTANDSGTFALQAHVWYLSEVRVGQRVHIRSRVLGRSERRLHVVHFMINEFKQDIASGFETLATHVDLSVRRSSPFPKVIRDNIDALLQEHQSLDWEPPLSGSIVI